MRRRPLATLFLVPVTFFILGAFYLHLLREFLPSTTTTTLPILLSSHHSHNLLLHDLRSPIRRLSSSPPPPQSLLLPDWQLLLLPSSPPTTTHNLSCLFRNGNTSPATTAGGSTADVAFRCSIPPSVRRLRPLLTPILVPTSDVGNSTESVQDPTETLRWNRPHVYTSQSTATDVIIFAKGINNRQGVNRPATDLDCVFLDSTGATAATTAVTSSAQQVFRCPHPDSTINPTAITIKYHAPSNATLPTLAVYRRWGSPTATPHAGLCACTMVLNVAKFLREWVVYHAGIGVEKFILYDNGSEDGLMEVVNRLSSEGFNISTRFWPWPKTQEAGFSHSAAVDVDGCDWMAYIDVDEFIFSPHWFGSVQPDRTMLGALVPADSALGQVSLSCRDFGPSGQRAHPVGGVMQGYICRRRAEVRHKSLVRLEAVDRSLVNSVHHFTLAEGWRTRRTRAAVVNHYKYQAWEEFKVKFRQRVSTYVVDWREAANAGSNDRTPGLGFEAVEPEGWADKFCQMNDTRLRDTTRRWFGEESGDGQYKMLWQE